jgi:hypothetical protein
MQALLYWLEDHFEALSEECEGRLFCAAARRLSLLCAALGDVAAMRAHSRALLAPPRDR